jgi:hypothetical protein
MPVTIARSWGTKQDPTLWTCEHVTAPTPGYRYDQYLNGHPVELCQACKVLREQGNIFEIKIPPPKA